MGESLRGGLGGILDRISLPIAKGIEEEGGWGVNSNSKLGEGNGGIHAAEGGMAWKYFFNVENNNMKHD